MRAATQSHLCGAIRTAFDQSGYRELRNVQISESDDGCLLIEGVVPTYYLKQLANALSVVTPGAFRIQNLITVGEAPIEGTSQLYPSGQKRA